LVQKTGEYLLEKGLIGLKVGNVVNHLHATMTQSKLPDVMQVSHVLKKEFKLAYRKYDGAMVNYTDPQFDEKRLWVSRLVT
jgi:hypothetical protein